MGKRWGSNEDIHIGDIFNCEGLIPRPDYYQVVALRGKTQVVLHAIHSETYINDGIAEDSPLSRKRTRPMPGQFMREDEMPGPGVYAYWKRDKEIRVIGEKVTAWVSLDRKPDGSPILLEVGELSRKFEIYYTLARPKDWEPWDEETIQKLEEYERARDEVFRERFLKGNKEVPWPEYPI